MSRAAVVGSVLATVAWSAGKLEAADGAWSFGAAPVASIHPGGERMYAGMSRRVIRVGGVRLAH